MLRLVCLLPRLHAVERRGKLLDLGYGAHS